jgi:outer membrane lipoprotein-sorting protein
MKRTLKSLAIALGISFASIGSAQADPAGAASLAKVDDAINRAKTQYLEYEATVQAGDKADRKIELAVWLKGEKRLSEFLGPADVKGTKVLILSPTQMYVYLPAFGKVRRIASHVTDQGFMGMHFTQDDLSISRYGASYEATIAKQDDKTIDFVLTAKKDAKPPYAKIELKVEKARNLPLEMRYFGESGKLLKTETRGAYTCEKDVCAPSELTMTDHGKTGAKTLLSRKKWKVNTDLSDDLFSKRNLEK